MKRGFRSDSVQHRPTNVSPAGFRSQSLQVSTMRSTPKPTRPAPTAARKAPAPEERRPEIPRGPMTSPRRPGSGLLPSPRDSSIGGTSMNPKLRRTSVLTVAAAMQQQQAPKNKNEPVDFNAPESQEAVRKLQKMFGPILLKRVLKMREKKRWKAYPPREYTMEAVIKAIVASKCALAEWPIDLLEQLCADVVFQYYKPKDVLVYAGEPHVSSGLIVLLYGQVTERRKDKNKSRTQTSSPHSPDRPIKSQKQRTRYSPDVLCVQSVLCEDRNASSIKASEAVDVAIISSRLIWELINSFVLESSKAPMLLERFRQTVIPNRTEMMLSHYYATSVLLMRSWMWPFLSGSDRVKLARSMEVKVLNIGDALFEEGSVCPQIYFLRRGSLTVVVKGEPLAVVEPGAAFGEVSVVFNEARNCSVVAGSICELYALHGNELYHRFKKYPELIKLITYKSLERRQLWLTDGKLRDVFSLVSILGGVPCLSHTTESMREELARRAQTRTVPMKHTIVRQNTPCTELFVIGRGSVLVGGKRAVAIVPIASATGDGEVRSVGDYFGELFLWAHLSPLDVVSETTLDLWVLSKEAVLEVLELNKAQVQAEEVCRQGISLYKTQHGDTSIVEGYERPVSSLNTSGMAVRRGSTGRTSSAASNGGGRRHSLASNSKASVEEEDSERTLTNFDWTGYVKERTVAQEGTMWRATQRELRDVDKATEKMLRNKVQALISVPPTLPPNAADCDFPGEVNDLQAIIVEQLLLIATEEQPRFLKQINDSNLRLITEGGVDEYEEPEAEVHVEDLGATDEFVPVEGIAKVEEIGSINSSEEVDEEGNQSLPFKNTMGMDNASFDRSGSNFISGPLQLGSYARLGSPGRKMSLPLDESTGAFPNMGARPSISRSHLVRPPSGLPPNSDARSPRNSIQRPISASEQLVLASQHRVRPASVDYSQQGKVNAEKSVSALDRFVKIEDKNYFNSVVKMLPLQEGEVWIPDEEEDETGPLMLMLLHVRSCARLNGDVARGGATFTVKVLKGSRVLLITSAQLGSSTDEGTHIRWPVGLASFVKFIHRGVELTFRLTHMTDTNERVVYEGTFQTALIGDKGGMGRCNVHMHTVKYDQRDTDSDDMEDPSLAPHLTVVVLAAMASSYKGLQQRLEANTTQVIRDIADDTSRHRAASNVTNYNEAHIQILAVEGLKHRIDASVRVTCTGADETETLLLNTPHVVPKSRNPCWCADGAYLALRSEGLIKFELFHKDQAIGSYRAFLDDIVFGGEGIRRVPLAAAHIEEPLGTLVVHVVSSSASTKTENRESERVLLLHVQELQVKNKDEYIIPPDLFAVVRHAGSDKTIMRTPLRFGRFNAAYSMEEASCLLVLPSVVGSSASYTIEVFDSDERSRIAEGTATVTDEGLGPDHQYIIPLGDHVQVQVHTQLLSVWDASALQRPAVRQEDHFKRDAPLTVVHIERCSFIDLQDPDNVMRTEALATLWCAGFECLRTTPRDYFTESPFAWAMEEASVALRVNPSDLTESAVLSLYDGLIDAADLVGEVTLPLTDLVRTGEFTYSVYPVDTHGRRKGHRPRGTVTVRTLCGRANGAVLAPGGSNASTALLEDSAGTFYSTALLDAPIGAGRRRAAPAQVRLCLTNVYQVLPKAGQQDGRGGAAGGHVHRAEGGAARRGGPVTPRGTWSEGGAVMKVRDFPCEITVRVTAANVQPRADGEGSPTGPDPAPPKRSVVVGEAKVLLTEVEATEARMF
ncbi:hypothetical protein STCU_08682, partial [Strigomonas culicis]